MKRRRQWIRGASFQPQLPYRNLDCLMRQVSARFFDHAYDDMTWCFAVQRQLPCITGTAPRIRIHNVLNAVDVPEHAFVTIIFHEMLDLEIPAVRTESGELNGHPPEFFAGERKRSPNLDASWEWLYGTLPSQSRPQRQCTDVLPRVTRLTQRQRAWAYERFGVALPRVIRGDDPAFRRISFATWRMAIEARAHSAPCHEDS